MKDPTKFRAEVIEVKKVEDAEKGPRYFAMYDFATDRKQVPITERQYVAFSNDIDAGRRPIIDLVDPA